MSGRIVSLAGAFKSNKIYAETDILTIAYVWRQMMRLSIILPVRPGAFPARCLQLLALSLADDDSVEVLLAEGNNPSRQRNQGARLANGEVLYFIDDDSYINEQTIEAGLRHFSNPDVTAVGGPSVTHSDASLFEQTTGAVLGSAFGAARTKARNRPVGATRQSDGEEITSCNLMIRKKDYILASGMNECLYPGEEMELLRRLASAGNVIYYEPDMIVSRTRRRTPVEFAKQYFSYGSARGRHILQTRQASDLIFVAPAFLLLVLLLAVIGITCLVCLPSQPESLYRLLTVLTRSAVTLLAVYTVFIVLSAGQILVKENPLIAFSSLLVFPLLHLAYGAGLLAGLFGVLYTRRNTGAGAVTIKALSLKDLSLDQNKFSSADGKDVQASQAKPERRKV